MDETEEISIIEHEGSTSDESGHSQGKNLHKSALSDFDFDPNNSQFHSKLQSLLPKRNGTAPRIQKVIVMRNVKVKASYMRDATPIPADTSSSGVKRINRHFQPSFKGLPGGNHQKNGNVPPSTLLLLQVQNALGDSLPMNWFTSVEKDGLHLMRLSFSKEKAIQRRIYVTSDGAVEISIHCKPLCRDIYKSIMSKAGTPCSLTKNNIQQFSQWLRRLLDVLRDYEVCCGVNRPDLKTAWEHDNLGFLDENPYQECRFSETYRSKECRKLVDFGVVRCVECSRVLCHLKRKLINVEREHSDKDASSSATEEDEIIELRDLQQVYCSQQP